MGHALRGALALAVVGAALLAAPGAASAKGIKGHCGEHLGALYRIDSGGARYHARFGPRDGVSGGTHHCHGIVFVRTGRAQATVSIGGIPGVWEGFNWLRWNLHTIVAANGTAASCVGFGIGLAGEAPTGAVDSWLTASGMVGCAGGTTVILHNLLGDGDGKDYCGATADHPICNARVGMR